MVQMKEPWFVGFNLFELFEMVSNGLRWFENVETLRATFLYFLWRYLNGIECQIRV